MSNGADECVIFPVHVKSGTLLEWLWLRHLYTPPSLWSLVEVLSRLGPSLSPRVTVSWHKVYSVSCDAHELNALTDLGYLASPTTCKRCGARVLTLLDKYRLTGDFSLVRQLSRQRCRCKTKWESNRTWNSALSLHDRLACAYRAIGLQVLGNQWWAANGRHSLSELDRCFS